MAEGAVTSLVEKVVDILFGKAKEEIGYMWNWSKNVKDLEKENVNLTLMRRRILQQIKAAEEKGDEILSGVEEWVAKAEFQINEAKKIIDGAKAESHISEAKEVTGGANAEVTEGANTESHVSVEIEVVDGANSTESSEEIGSVEEVNTETHISEAKEDIDGVEGIANKTCCNLGMCVNPCTRYSYGKKAANKARLLKTVQEEWKSFESRVSVSRGTPSILDAYERKFFDDLDTHKLCFEKIMKSIKDENIQIIGIHGIGGVGKTTLAKEVGVTVKSLFAAVEFITVSQPVDVKRIKKEVEVAAKRIQDGQKILVILDDLWEGLQLDELGIRCGTGDKNCKILLTSRSEDVCKTMNATRLISVDTLTRTEAWIFFKSVVGGDTVEKDKKLKEIAEEIVEGCGGLPLILQVVGATLKNENLESWKQALTQLQKQTTSDIDPNISLAYSRLKLSYDFLRSEEAKSCFLLCCMFPEDSNIPLKRLAQYGVGLEIFKDLDSMEDARNRVRRAVKILKSTCMLLDGKNELKVKMHDVVREVALLIASGGSNKFLVKAGVGLYEWEPRPKRVKSCTGISLMGNRIEMLPDYELDIPLLDIFLIQGNWGLSTIPDQFFLGVKEARVIDFERNKIRSLPKSMKQLTKLCMLNLGWNGSLCDISILGDLKSLEILILSFTGIVEIPQEIGNLVALRRLEVKGCEGLSHIAPGVMSKLRWLEELHLGYYGVEEGNNEGLMEIGKLSRLTFLDLFVPYIHLIPKGVCFTKLKGFVIQIGGDRQVYEATDVVHNKTLILGMKDLDTPSMLQVKELIELSDGVIFKSVDNPNNLVPTMYCESLDDLTTIMLAGCDNLISLVEYSSDRDEDEELGGEYTKKQFFSKLEHLLLFFLDELQVLWKCPDEDISLKNLLTLEIVDCHKLERLFSVNVARGLVNLQTLRIVNCFRLKEVIWDGDEGDHNERVVFQRLVKIELWDLDSGMSQFKGSDLGWGWR